MFMGSGKIDVDIMALHDLKGAIKRASEGMTDISQSVDSYLEETLEHMQRTIDFFRQKLEIAQREVDKAEAALSKAQSAYDACLRSQREVKDEDGRTRYVPSCAFEGGRVNLCRKAVEAAERVSGRACARRMEKESRCRRTHQKRLPEGNRPLSRTRGNYYPSRGTGDIVVARPRPFRPCLREIRRNNSCAARYNRKR